jgi:type IX secretion system PorP/SprF family membrane protein
MKYLYTVLVMLSLNIIGNSQQLSSPSLMPGVQFRNNPAMVASGRNMQYDGFFRMQWIGFSGAPAAGFVSVQYPFQKLNMGAGAILHFDKTGPVSKVGLSLNYAYKLKELLTDRDQLSFGLSADVQQYSFSGAGQIVNDPNEKFLTQNQSSFFPALGLGVYYMSTTRMFKENMFFAGFSSDQAFTTDVLVNNINQTRARHYNAIVGGRMFKYDSYIEPMISLNIVQPDIINVLYGLRYEKEDTFWAGIGYESAGILGFQGGVILTNLGGDEDGIMRLGILSNYGITSQLLQAGPSVEFSLSYAIDR